jgi:proton-coupled amino acid transporter
MEKFAFTHALADILIFTTAIMIIVFSIMHVVDNDGKWGEGIEIINESTWLTIIGSAIYSYEGIGTIIPILEVTENPKQFPKIVLYVLLTNMLLYTGFGEFCMFVYGKSMTGVPLITEMLDGGWPVYLIKILYSINVVISIALQQVPANLIAESYIFYKMKKSALKTTLINILRVAMLGGCIVLCIVVGDKLDKFNSLIGTFAATPVAFTFPCILHYKLCNPGKIGKILDILVLIFSAFVLVFCTAFNIWTWKD